MDITCYDSALVEYPLLLLTGPLGQTLVEYPECFHINLITAPACFRDLCYLHTHTPHHINSITRMMMISMRCPRQEQQQQQSLPTLQHEQERQDDG